MGVFGHYTANLRSEDDGTVKFLAFTTYLVGVEKFSELSEILDLGPILSPANFWPKRP